MAGLNDDGIFLGESQFKFPRNIIMASSKDLAIWSNSADVTDQTGGEKVGKESAYIDDPASNTVLDTPG